MSQNLFIINSFQASFLIAILALTACSSDPNKEKRAYWNSGLKYYQSGKYQEAVIQFRNATELDSRFSKAHLQLARAYLRLGNSEAAYRELTETVSLEPKNPDAQLELANVPLARRQYDEAQAAAQEALKVVPNSAQAHALLGAKYFLTHDRQNAIQELRKAVDADPQRVEGYAALGAAYLAAGQIAEGEVAYQKAVEVNSRSMQAHLALGQFWFSQGKLTEAEAEMRTAVGIDSHVVLPRLFLARILVATDRLNDAEKVYTELKTVARDDPRAYQALGLFYSSRGQRDKAAAEFQSVLASKPKDAAVKANLIAILIDLGRMKEARALNQEVLTRIPAIRRASCQMVGCASRKQSTRKPLRRYRAPSNQSRTARAATFISALPRRLSASH